jgi:lysine 2,3-aminomutase
VLDIPGGHGKAPIGPGFIQAQGPGRWLVSDFRGATHLYPPLVPERT